MGKSSLHLRPRSLNLLIRPYVLHKQESQHLSESLSSKICQAAAAASVVKLFMFKVRQPFEACQDDSAFFFGKAQLKASFRRGETHGQATEYWGT